MGSSASGGSGDVRSHADDEEADEEKDEQEAKTHAGNSHHWHNSCRHTTACRHSFRNDLWSGKCIWGVSENRGP